MFQFNNLNKKIMVDFNNQMFINMNMMNNMNGINNQMMIPNQMMANQFMYNNLNANQNNILMMNQINQINLLRNSPIEGSTLVLENTNNNFKYYQYPLDIQFSDEEEKSSKVVLLIGQTGTGKTSFINSMINIYLGVTINDNFRYLISSKEKKNVIICELLHPFFL